MTVFLVLVAVLGVRGWGAGEPELDDLRRRALAAEDRRFRRTVELARMYSDLGRPAEARRLYEEARALRADDLDVAGALLQALRRLGDHEAQLPLYRRLSSSRLGDAKLQMQTGECLWRLKRTGEAREVWFALLKRFPAERAVYDDLVDFYIAEGLPAEARGIIRRRRGRFGEDGGVLLMEARLAIAGKKPADALPSLLACLELDLSWDDRRRAEVLLFTVAKETGKTAEVRRKLTESLESIDGQLAGRLMDLAEKAAGEKHFAEAVALARRALPLVKDAAKRALLTSRITHWRAKARP